MFRLQGLKPDDNAIRRGKWGGRAGLPVVQQ